MLYKTTLDVNTVGEAHCAHRVIGVKEGVISQSSVLGDCHLMTVGSLTFINF